MPRRLRADFYLHWLENPKLRVRGWNIRLSYIDEGRLRYRRKLVSESRYGGTKKSLMVIAMRLRDRIIAELGTSTFGVPYFQREKSNRNTSGHIGVYRNVEVRNRKIEVIWAARWRDAQGKVVMRRFFARRHGEENAKKLAVIYGSRRGHSASRDSDFTKAFPFALFQIEAHHKDDPTHLTEETSGVPLKFPASSSPTAHSHRSRRHRPHL
jgi:hypothetical protein